MLRAFVGSNPSAGHKLEGISEVVNSLGSGRWASEDGVILVVGPRLGEDGPDLLLILRDSLCVVDFEVGAGRVVGSEDSDWFAEGVKLNVGLENPFMRVSRHRLELVRALGKASLDLFQPHFLVERFDLASVRGLLLFDSGVNYDHSQLHEENRVWFRVGSVHEVGSLLSCFPRGGMSLGEAEMEALLFGALGLSRSDEVDPRALSLTRRTSPSISSDAVRSVRLPFEVEVGSLLSRAQKILHYFRYCLVLEDIKNSEIPDDALKVDVDLEKLYRRLPFSVKRTADLERFLRKRKLFAGSVNPSLLLAYPVLDLGREKLPVFVFYVEASLDEDDSGDAPGRSSSGRTASSSERPEFVSFRLLSEGEVSKLFISKGLGLTDPEHVEHVKSMVDEAGSLSERVKALSELIRSSTSALVDEEGFRSLMSTTSGLLFWSFGQFNVNVIRELGELSKINAYSCPFDAFLAVSPVPSGSPRVVPGILPFSELNEQQLRTVGLAFGQALTTVTGPPGTGKTQVSLNVMANAVLSGKRVLFAAKNNKAVDDVCAKLDAIFEGAPLSPLLRLGNRGVIHSLPEVKLSPAIDALKKLKKEDLESYGKERDSLRAKVDKIASRVEELRGLIARVDSLERRLEGLRCELDYKAELYGFLVRSRSRLIEELERRAGEIKSKVPPAVLEELCRRGGDVGISWGEVEGCFGEFRVKLSGKLSLWERFVSLFLRDYLRRKYRAKLELFLGELGEPLRSFVSDLSGEDPLRGFELLLELKTWEERVRDALALEERAGAERRALERMASEGVAVAERLEGEISSVEQELRALSRRRLNRNLERLGRILVSLSRKLLVSSYLASISLDLVGALESVKGKIEVGREEGRKIDISEEFDDLLRLFPVVAVTNLSVGTSVPLRPRMFDLLIVDEASQSDLASALPLIYRAKRVAVVGDPMQLRHISGLSLEEDMKIAEACGLKEMGGTYSRVSLYDMSSNLSKLSLKPVVFLHEHYRSHRDIINFSNKHFYSHLGKVLVVKTPSERLKFCLVQGLCWLNVEGEELGNANPSEAEEIFKVLGMLLPKLREGISVGVTTPFRNQANLLAKRLAVFRDEFDVDLVADTVHRFQGDEKDLVFLSLVVSPSSKESLLRFINVSAKQLLNVAVTRGRSCVVVVGNRSYALSSVKRNFDPRWGTDYLRLLALSSRPISAEIFSDFC